MALNQAKLQADILNVFSSMTGADDTVFSNGLSDAFSAFVNGGVPVTVDQGVIPAGTFTGASTGGFLSSDGSGCASVIAEACAHMRNHQEGGDDYLADKIAQGLQVLVEGTKVTTTVSGVAVPPSPPPPTVPVAGTARGTISCGVSPVSAGLKAAFSSMKVMQGGGDTFLAQTMASLVFACIKSAIVSTDGQEALFGSKGLGTLS